MLDVPAPAQWWTEPQYNILERDVVHLAMVELQKEKELIACHTDESLEAAAAKALHEVKMRHQQTYFNIRQRGRKTPRWDAYMKLVIAEVRHAR